MNPDARFAIEHGENYDEENDVANDEGGIGNDDDDGQCAGMQSPRRRSRTCCRSSLQITFNQWSLR